MKLFYAAPSPYSSKVRMAARHLGLEIEAEHTKTGPENEALNSANPLGKIPCLVLDDGSALFDSRAIMQEFNRLERNKLFPSGKDKRRAAERIEALADGMCDAMLLMVYEERYRPEERRHEDWVEMQWEKVVRSLDWLEQNPARVTNRLHGGQFALASALGYADFRLPDRNWRRGHPKTKRFLDRFAERFEGWDELKPQAPPNAA